MSMNTAPALSTLPQRREKPSIETMAGCVAFWDFNRTLASRGGSALNLREISGEWEWADGGIFGASCVRIHPGGGFIIPRQEIGALDIHGADCELSVCVWFLRESPDPWQALAGVWDESRGKRQYYLFLNARSRTLNGTTTRVECSNRIHGHISDVGGPTPGLPCCVTYASGATEIPMQRWTMAAMTYKQGTVRVYVNGELDACPESNPFDGPASVFDGGRDGADFSIGTNSVRGTWSNLFGGLIGGVAVFRRALSDGEMRVIGGH